MKNLIAKIEGIVSDHWYPLTLGLFSFPLWCLLVAVFGFIVFIPVTKFHTIVAFALSLATIAWACGGKWKQTLLFSLCYCPLLLVPFLMSAFLFGRGGDPAAFNLPQAILMVKHQWNPIYQDDYTKVDAERAIRESICGRCYCKGDRIISAVLYGCTQNLMAGTVLQFIFAVIVLPISCAALSALFPLSKWKIFVLSFAVTVNPVSMSQLYSGKEDGVLGSILTVLFLCLTAYLKSKDQRFLPFILGSAILGTNIKFTGVPYVGIFLVAVLLPLAFWAWRKKKEWDKKLTRTIITATVLSMVVGINPYFYNIYRHWHPFYPLMTLKKGETPLNIMASAYPPDMKKANPLQRFIFSYMIPVEQNTWRFKGRFTFDPSAIFVKNATGEAAGLGGFGALFCIPLAFSFLMFPFIRDKYAWLLFIGLWLTILSQPHSWWARYAPQVWLVPIIVIGAVWSSMEELNFFKKRMSIVACLLLACCLFSGLINFSVNFCRYVLSAKDYASLLRCGDDKVFMVNDTEYHGGAHWLDYTIDYSMIPDCFPRAGRTKPENAELMFRGYEAIYFYISPSDHCHKLRLRNFPTIVYEILNLRLRQFKRVWGLAPPPYEQKPAAPPALR